MYRYLIRVSLVLEGKRHVVFRKIELPVKLDCCDRVLLPGGLGEVDVDAVVWVLGDPGMANVYLQEVVLVGSRSNFQEGMEWLGFKRVEPDG